MPLVVAAAPQKKFDGDSLSMRYHGLGAAKFLSGEAS